MSRQFRFQGEVTDEDEVRELVRNAIEDQLDNFVCNVPPDEDEEDEDDDEAAAFMNMHGYEDDEDELPLPTYNNKRFAKGLKLSKYVGSDNADEDDDGDELDLPHYDPAAFRIR